MQIAIDCPFEFFMELRAAPDPSSHPLHHESIMGDLAELVDETYTRGVLSENLPAEADLIHCRLRPDWSGEPLVRSIEIELEAERRGQRDAYSLCYSAGRWTRRSPRLAGQLRGEGTLGEDQTVYSLLVAARNGSGPALRVPPLQPPTVVAQSLDDFGVRSLGDGSLVPDRPVLVNARMVDDIVRLTEEAGPNETGGAVLGKNILLPEPLPGSATRVVTILSTSIVDSRHLGVPARFTFSPDALAEAEQIARTRGCGESVLTVFHSHGWGTACGKCNQNENCLLPQCSYVSGDDYQVLESLFPSKATLLPIAGRKLGEAGQRPVLEIHAWRGGEVRAVRWKKYDD